MTEFCKVGAIGPDSDGVSFHAKVVGCAVSVERESASGTSRAADVLVGDETGCVHVTATGDQIDSLQPGKSVTLRSARLRMQDGCVRLIVDQWGSLERLEPGLTCEVDLDNNRSLLSFKGEGVGWGGVGMQ